MESFHVGHTLFWRKHNKAEVEQMLTIQPNQADLNCKILYPETLFRMPALEIGLLIVAYSVLIVTIFFEVICYQRNLETIETIFFTLSLLGLITALTATPILINLGIIPEGGIILSLPMILVGVATILNTLSERKHTLPTWVKPLLIGLGIAIGLTTICTQFLGIDRYSGSITAVYLGIAVTFSMLLIRNTKPANRIAHLEKTERIFAVVFLILVPFSLLSNYVFGELGYNLQFGFTLPIVFILLAGNKLWDDLQRLSLIPSDVEPTEQHFKNFTLTEREKEIALVLSKGYSYKKISEDLFISIPTVKTHASNVYKKCEVKNRAELILLLTR